jgi:hypothetical protein
MKLPLLQWKGSELTVGRVKLDPSMIDLLKVVGGRRRDALNSRERRTPKREEGEAMEFTEILDSADGDIQENGIRIDDGHFSRQFDRDRGTNISPWMGQSGECFKIIAIAKRLDIAQTRRGQSAVKSIIMISVLL